ncbi:MAG TPA: hypothetical protein VF076_07100 [Acidimicrobiales bacterium]
MTDVPRTDLVDAAWLMTRAAGLLVLGRMREIEEQLLDPAQRWETLRTALERFASTRLER